MKKILIAGASGMVGGHLLEEALASDRVAKVISLVRKAGDKRHPKLQERLIEDFSDYSNSAEIFKDVDAAYFCIGVYTGKVPDDQFKVITVDYAVAFAQALQENSPKAKFCLLSGQGADRTEKSRMSFAKYKGMAENQISELGLIFFSFRPAYIYPSVARKEPNLMYTISRWLYPLIKLLGKNASIPSADLAKAMFQVGLDGADKPILENRDILKVLKA
jgi:uncharacterized protein YbjT (DUF2867 family)